MKKQLKILHTSDTHGYLNDISFHNKEEVNYGLSKVSTLVDFLKDDNTLVIDTGDTIQGSPLMYFYKNNYKKYDNPVAKVFNHIKYDYICLGNHDFNYGLDYLYDFTSAVHPTILNSNMLQEDKPFVGKEYDIRIMSNGLKVALFGITTDFINVWESEENRKGITIHNAYEKALVTVGKIKNENPDIIIALYHGGVEKNLYTKEIESETTENEGIKIFDSIPEIDCLLTGHQHREIIYKENNRVLSQPSSFGKKVSELVVTFEDEKITDINGKLHALDDVSSDKKVNEILKDIVTDTNIFLDQIIGYNKQNDLVIKDALESRVQVHKVVSLINKIQREASGAMISCMALSNVSTGFNKEISIRDVLNTYVYPNTLFVVKIPGDKLKEALEQNASFFELENNQIRISKNYEYPKLEYYNYDMYSPIEYTIKVSNPKGSKIVSLSYQGKPVNKEDVFTLVMSSYRFNGGGEFKALENLEFVKEIPLDISELLIDYIKEKKIIEVEKETNIKVII